jgi:hypothetical protein
MNIIKSLKKEVLRYGFRRSIKDEISEAAAYKAALTQLVVRTSAKEDKICGDLCLSWYSV